MESLNPSPAVRRLRLPRLGRLDRRLKHPGVFLAAPLIAVGLAGVAITVADRASDGEFLARQQYLTAIRGSAVASVLEAAPNPRPGLGKPRAVSASCRSFGAGELRNPWTCHVRYSRGGSVDYLVLISPDGHVKASDPSGQITIDGCCVGSHPIS